MRDDVTRLRVAVERECPDAKVVRLAGVKGGRLGGAGLNLVPRVEDLLIVEPSETLGRRPLPTLEGGLVLQVIVEDVWFGLHRLVPIEVDLNRPQHSTTANDRFGEGREREETDLFRRGFDS